MEVNQRQKGIELNKNNGLNYNLNIGMLRVGNNDCKRPRPEPEQYISWFGEFTAYITTGGFSPISPSALPLQVNISKYYINIIKVER